MIVIYWANLTLFNEPKPNFEKKKYIKKKDKVRIQSHHRVKQVMSHEGRPRTIGGWGPYQISLTSEISTSLQPIDTINSSLKQLRAAENSINLFESSLIDMVFVTSVLEKKKGLLIVISVLNWNFFLLFRKIEFKFFFNQLAYLKMTKI